MNKMGSGFWMLWTSRKTNIILAFLSQLAMKWWAGWGRKRKVLELCKFVPLSSTLLHFMWRDSSINPKCDTLEGQLKLRVHECENVKSTFRITHLNFFNVQQWVTFRVEESRHPFTKFRSVGRPKHSSGSTPHNDKESRWSWSHILRLNMPLFCKSNCRSLSYPIFGTWPKISSNAGMKGINSTEQVWFLNS